MARGQLAPRLPQRRREQACHNEEVTWHYGAGVISARPYSSSTRKGAGSQAMALAVLRNDMLEEFARARAVDPHLLVVEQIQKL